MALSDLAVFSEYTYASMTEVLNQQIDLFNGASNGAIQLNSVGNSGDFTETAMFAKISGLVRRRNAYGSGTVTPKNLSNIKEVSVKVAAGTPPVQIDPGQFAWIQQSPELAGAVIGQQLAKDYLQDMLNVGLGAAGAALSGVTEVLYDATGNTAPEDTMSLQNLNSTQALFGDASADLVCWVMNSKPLFDLYGKALTNTERLFTYGSVNVVRDPFGRVMLMTDNSNLVVTGTPTKYRTLGLTAGGIVIEQNNDFFANETTLNGDENIQRTYQAEWSYNAYLKGFAWDKTNGGKSPSNAALVSSANWDKFVTSHKDLAGVICLTK